MGYILILIKTLTNISEGVLIKKYNEKHSAGGMFFTGILSLFALLFFTVTDNDGYTFPTQMIPYAVAFGLIYCIAYATTFVAIAYGSFTMSMLIISYSLLMPIVYGIIWLDEAVTVFTCIGFALLIISLFLVRGKDEGEKTGFSMKWLVAILITTIGNGLLAIITKAQQIKFDNTCNNEFMMIALAISSAVLLTGGIIKDRKDLRDIIRHGIPYAGSAGIANGMTNLLGIYVNNLLPLSLVSPISAGAKIVISFLSAKLLFKESYMKRQVVGVIIGTVALIFLNLT